MRILNISTNDHANFAHDNARALRSVGVDCVDVKTAPHKYGYGSESKPTKPVDIKAMLPCFDVIQIFHSDLYLLEMAKYCGKRLVVYHTGSGYRQNPTKHDEAFNPFVDLSVIALCEFSKFNAKNAHYLVGAIEFNPNKRPKKLGEKLIFAHYPSDPKIKGTEQIKKMMRSIKGNFVFDCSTEILSHEAQFNRMEKCDVYIELFNPEINGNQYGSWGITALEAAAMGKIVVTQNLNHDFYLKNYQYCPLVLCDMKNDFIKKVQSIVDMTHERIENLKLLHLDWIEDNHTFKETGKRLIEILSL